MGNSVPIAVRVALSIPMSAGSLRNMDRHAGRRQVLSDHHGLSVGHWDYEGLVQVVNIGFGVAEAKLERFADGLNIPD